MITDEMYQAAHWKPVKLLYIVSGFCLAIIFLMAAIFAIVKMFQFILNLL